jgi:hypothetical protein
VIVTKRVEGEVQFNDGEFAEVQTYGIEGIEKDLLLKTVHIHRGDTDNTSVSFKRHFPWAPCCKLQRQPSSPLNWNPVLIGRTCELL